jgi:hypothetical protein
MKGKIALIMLAIVGILMAPALSMPQDKGASNAKHFGMQLLSNNLTDEQMNNMTLGELREMRQRTWNNASCQSKDIKQNQSDNGHQEMKGSRWMRNNADKRDDSDKNGGFKGKLRENTRNGHVDEGSLILLLIDDLNVDKLNNMTLNQIKDLKQQKMEELNNMTLNQIRELQESKIQEQNNMTIGELWTKNQECHQISMIMGLGKNRAEMMHRDEAGKNGGCSMTNQEGH